MVSVSPLSLAAMRWGLIKPLVPALLLVAPISMTVGLVNQGHAHDGESEVLARVVTVDKQPSEGLLVDLDPTYAVTLVLPNGDTRSLEQQVPTKVGADLRVFTSHGSVRSATERDVARTLGQIVILTVFLGLAILAGWVSYRRQVGRSSDTWG